MLNHWQNHICMMTVESFLFFGILKCQRRTAEQSVAQKTMFWTRGTGNLRKLFRLQEVDKLASAALQFARGKEKQ